MGGEAEGGRAARPPWRSAAECVVPALQLLELVLCAWYFYWLRDWAKDPAPAIGHSWRNILLAALLVLALVLHIQSWSRDRGRQGRKLYARGDHVRARRMLEKASGEKLGSETLLIMGDMHMDGLGGPADPERAVERYAGALDAAKREPGGVGAWIGNGTLEDVLSRVRPSADAGKPAAQELAAGLLSLLGRDGEALAYARRLPDDGRPGRQTECLVRIMREKEPAPRAEGREEDAPGGPDIRVPVTWRSSHTLPFTLAAVTALASFIAFVLFTMEHGAGILPLAAFLAVSAACGCAALRLWIGGHYRRGCDCAARLNFNLAAQHFTRGMDALDPRSTMSLGGMRQYGLGFPVDFEAALAAYRRSALLLRLNLRMRGAPGRVPGWGRLFTPILRPRYGMWDSQIAETWGGLRRRLEDMIGSGFDGDGAYGLLFTVLGELNDWRGVREHALARQEARPDPKNLALAAEAEFSDPAAGEADIGAALRALERLAGEGQYSAAARLAREYGGVGARKGFEDAEKARTFLSAAFGLAGSLPGPERDGAVRHLKFVAGRLLERHGAGFLDDRLCLAAMG